MQDSKPTPTVNPIAPPTVTQKNCRAFGFSESWFLRLVKTHDVRHSRIGKLVIVETAELLRVIREHEVTTGDSSEAPVSLADIRAQLGKAVAR